MHQPRPRPRPRREEFLRQFEGVFGLLNSWMDEHAAKIDRAYLSFGRESVGFLVIQKSREFDRSFDESLLDLDIRIARDERYHLVHLDVLSLPYCSEESARSCVEGFSPSL